MQNIKKIFKNKISHGMKTLLSKVPYLIIAILVGLTISYAGSLTPPGPVANTMYTLDDIYTKLTTNADATLGLGTIPTTPGTPASTFYTLTELYTAIPTIDATKVLTGTTYLGVAGSAYGDATQAKVLTTATGAGTYDASNLAVGKVANGVTFGVSSTGTLFGDTDASKVLDTATYAGTMSTQTLSAGSTTVNAGYYAGTTLTAVDADLAAANILSGTTIFGVAGSASAGVSYPTLWSADATGGVDVDWATAVAYCAALTEGSVAPGTWHLPTYIELVNAFLTSVAGFQILGYWSGSTDPGNSGYAYSVDMYTGVAYYGDKTGPYYLARCAR